VLIHWRIPTIAGIVLNIHVSTVSFTFYMFGNAWANRSMEKGEEYAWVKGGFYIALRSRSREVRTNGQHFSKFPGATTLRIRRVTIRYVYRAHRYVQQQLCFHLRGSYLCSARVTCPARWLKLNHRLTREATGAQGRVVSEDKGCLALRREISG